MLQYFYWPYAGWNIIGSTASSTRRAIQRCGACSVFGQEKYPVDRLLPPSHSLSRTFGRWHTHSLLLFTFILSGPIPPLLSRFRPRESNRAWLCGRVVALRCNTPDPGREIKGRPYLPPFRFTELYILSFTCKKSELLMQWKKKYFRIWFVSFVDYTGKMCINHMFWAIILNFFINLFW